MSRGNLHFCEFCYSTLAFLQGFVYINIEVILMTTGQRIKARRKAIGLSAEKLADILGVSPATIYRYENGDIDKVPGERLAPIANALQTTPGFLMGWEDPADSPPHVAQSDKNIIKIAARDGSYIERRLTDDQLAALTAILDQMPDVPDDL